ncbi:MAG: tRNA-dihydrouridine synthase family protein [Spirochaetia bacterium]|nr:tRNA-dihydrouridine synthase family protein [Spirochaetia bacterium]
MKLICGPMATISHPAFRILVEQFGGCDEYYTEMINAGTVLTNGPFEHYYLDPAPVPEKLVWQLTGRTNEHMIEASRMLVELPGIGIDLNMGCSAPDIYRFGAGIAWMMKPVNETEAMVRGVQRIIEKYNGEHPENLKRFSVKLRLGDDNFTDDQFYSFCDMLVNNGVQLLTLHPRTKKERLIRPARYEYCEYIAERYKDIPVYLNGNVKDKNSFDYAISKAPSVKGVMISRASVKEPWIFKNLKGHSPVEVDMKELALEYIRNIQIYQPEEFWKTRLQRFFTYYADNFKFSHYAQTQFVNSKNIDELKVKINEFFEKCPEELKKIV